MKFKCLCAALMLSCSAVSAQTATSNEKLFSSIKSNTEDKVVATGVDTVIDFYTDLKPDCTMGGPVQYRVLKKPAHGVLSLANGEQFPAYEAPNVRVACASKKTMALELHYKSSDGFVGRDSLEIVVIYPGGYADRDIYMITVG